MNPYHQKIAKLQGDLALLNEQRGEILLNLDKAARDKELQGQLEQTESEIKRIVLEIERLQVKATAFERADKEALAKAQAEQVATAGEEFSRAIEAMASTAAAFDAAVESVLAIMASFEEHAQAAMRSGRAAGIRADALHNLLNLNPLSVVLADRLSRHGWARLPFLDVSHPRNPASCQVMVEARRAKLVAMLERAKAEA
jgi:chromosome segregation ATPase